MKILLVIGILAVAAVLLFLHLRSHRDSGRPVIHVENSFEFTVPGPYQTVAPLFGALAERSWAGEDWNPKFLHPLPPRDEAGEVFTIKHGHHSATWVNTALDLQAGHFQYVYFIPEVQVALIDVNVQARDASDTDVKVLYRRTALDASVNNRIAEIGRKDAQAGPEWASAIEACLRGGQQPGW